jgi:hypothetical protein
MFKHRFAIPAFLNQQSANSSAEAGAQLATANVVSTISTANEQRMIRMTRTRMAAQHARG